MIGGAYPPNTSYLARPRSHLVGLSIRTASVEAVLDRRQLMGFLVSWQKEREDDPPSAVHTRYVLVVKHLLDLVVQIKRSATHQVNTTTTCPHLRADRKSP